jgi:hypothetical protein
VLDANEKSDLGKVDRELAFRRFSNKNGQRFTPDSLDTYRHRFNAALNEFEAYLKDPSGYRPSAVTRDRVSSTRGASRAQQAESPAQRTAQTERSGNLLAYPLPLPSGEVAQLLLPPVITTGDAQRIATLVAAMVNALAMEKKP